MHTQDNEILNHRIYPGETPQAEKEIPLIILHGLFGSMDNWRSQAKSLSAKRPARWSLVDHAIYLGQ